MAAEDISISKDQGVLALGLNRPSKLNAITREMYSILAREISAANTDDEVGDRKSTRLNSSH